MRSLLVLIILVAIIAGMIVGIFYLDHSKHAGTSTTSSPSVQDNNPLKSIPDQTLLVSSQKADIIFSGVLKNIYVKDNQAYITLSITNSNSTFDKDFIVTKGNTSTARIRKQINGLINPLSTSYKDYLISTPNLISQLHPFINKVVLATVSTPSNGYPPYVNEALKQSIGDSMSCNIIFVGNGINKIIRPEGCPPFVSMLSILASHM